MKDEYQEAARCYDCLIEPFVKSIRREVLSIARRNGWRRVLDLCSGTGAQAKLLGRHNIPVVGIDLSPAMLEQARSAPDGTVPFILGDGARLPFRERVFDAVMIEFALHEKRFQAVVDMIGEAYRVLEERGMLLIVDFELPSDPASKLAHWGVKAVERLAGRDHYACFRKYIARGGFGEVVKTSGFEEFDCSFHHFGAVGLHLFKKRCVPQ